MMTMSMTRHDKTIGSIPQADSRRKIELDARVWAQLSWIMSPPS